MTVFAYAPMFQPAPKGDDLVKVWRLVSHSTRGNEPRNGYSAGPLYPRQPLTTRTLTETKGKSRKIFAYAPMNYLLDFSPPKPIFTK